MRVISETPEHWVVLHINNSHYKVFAGWRGGYTSGDNWVMNSGIKSVEEDEDNYYFHGHSGSCYKCSKNRYGLKEGLYHFSPYVQNTLERITSTEGHSIFILDEKTDFMSINY